LKVQADKEMKLATPVAAVVALGLANVLLLCLG